jgi:hypothetical protein
MFMEHALCESSTLVRCLKTSLLTALLAVALTTAVYDLDSKAFAQKKKEYQEIFLRK